MRVLVTGGNGMVGRNFINVAANKGYDVIAPTRRELDLTVQTEVSSYFNDCEPDLVLHCAGLVGGIQANISAPYDFCVKNLLMGCNVVDSAVRAGVKNLLNLGSSCMYPCNALNPLNEGQILNGKLEPTNEGYAIAKVSVARLCDYASQQYDVSFKTIIPCNLFGEWDKFNPEASHMIPAVIRKLHEAKISGDSSVDIWGDGLARREFMLAEDLADFICFAIQRHDRLEAYTNVGVGTDHSINEFYTEISKVVGFEGAFKHDLSKPSGMKQKLVDVSKQKNLGWKPNHSLREGLIKTYQHFLDYQKDY